MSREVISTIEEIKKISIEKLANSIVHVRSGDLNYKATEPLHVGHYGTHADFTTVEPDPNVVYNVGDKDVKNKFIDAIVCCIGEIGKINKKSNKSKIIKHPNTSIMGNEKYSDFYYARIVGDLISIFYSRLFEGETKWMHGKDNNTGVSYIEADKGDKKFQEEIKRKFSKALKKKINESKEKRKLVTVNSSFSPDLLPIKFWRENISQHGAHIYIRFNKVGGYVKSLGKNMNWFVNNGFTKDHLDAVIEGCIMKEAYERFVEDCETIKNSKKRAEFKSVFEKYEDKKRY